jgi:DNA-binding response OmpR family regulator
VELDPGSATILLVEDDAASAADVTRALCAGGHTVWHAETGADARAILRQGQPDLIVLDLTLPDVDGLVFCTSLKTEAPDLPFMICSTGTTTEKVLSFTLGAEDFVAKPFDLLELQARIDAILRRRARVGAAPPPSPPAVTTPADSPPTNLGRLRVDLAHWRVTIDDKWLELTPTEFQLLVFMAHRPGAIISREELARGVWGDESMSRSRTIDAYVRRITAKLSSSLTEVPDERAPRILNIRGCGYQLAVPIVTSA